jgi:hypothetical protein
MTGSADVTLRYDRARAPHGSGREREESASRCAPATGVGVVQERAQSPQRTPTLIAAARERGDGALGHGSVWVAARGDECANGEVVVWIQVGERIERRPAQEAGGVRRLRIGVEDGVDQGHHRPCTSTAPERDRGADARAEIAAIEEPLGEGEPGVVEGRGRVQQGRGGSRGGGVVGGAFGHVAHCPEQPGRDPGHSQRGSERCEAVVCQAHGR